MVFCVMLGCTNDSVRDKGTYCRIPVVREHEGEEERRKSEERRRLWVKAIAREDLTEAKLRNERVCWRHFVSGVAAAPWDVKNADWVPTLNLGHEKFDASSAAVKRSARTERLHGRKKRQLAAAFYESSSSTSTAVEDTSQLGQEQPDSEPEDTSSQQPVMPGEAATQTDLTGHDIASLENKIHELYSLMYQQHRAPPNELRAFSTQYLMHDNDRVKYYTALPNFTILSVIFHFVREHVACGKSMSAFSEFFLTLMKLRLNLGVQDLAYRFGVSAPTVSRIIRRWLVALDTRLTPACIVWPDREDLQKTMPLCFRQSFGRKVVVVIDCFEVFIDRPSNLMARAETWSQYKHHNTAKFLIGITPQGVVSFISQGWGGRVSDKRLTEASGLLNKLLPGDVVLADRGFTVGESVALMGAQLHMPAFTKGRDQLTALEVEQSRTISNVRIHVERVIGTVRQKYTVLGGPLPVDFVSKSPGETVPLADRMVRVCCCLSNLCESVVPLS